MVLSDSELGDWCIAQDDCFGVSVVDMQCLDILRCKFDRRTKATQNGSLFIRPGGMPGTSGRAKSRAETAGPPPTQPCGNRLPISTVLVAARRGQAMSSATPSHLAILENFSRWTRSEEKHVLGQTASPWRAKGAANSAAKGASFFEPHWVIWGIWEGGAACQI
ncbi:hypothetical protein MHUMG1_00079 [Metarhizium humberi]|uniref:Uncharacterized protein n=1 Tax=Metarhizium humberi TaxID=2596975 RepID=A0A9P8MJ09_9HYPO|nr:hypothetical protein MHUMG1_00079 [Metarhizium humberi]